MELDQTCEKLTSLQLVQSVAAPQREYKKSARKIYDIPMWMLATLVAILKQVELINLTLKQN